MLLSTPERAREREREIEKRRQGGEKKYRQDNYSITPKRLYDPRLSV